MGLLRQSDPWDTGGMYRVEIYGRVRRAVLVEGRSQRAVAGAARARRQARNRMHVIARRGIGTPLLCIDEDSARVLAAWTALIPRG